MPIPDATPDTNPVPRSALRAPRFPATTGPWFNGGPLGDWRGRVTLVDFWTYSCINCLRTLPALQAWHARYAAHGLTILGVHTPEFSFEHDRDDLHIFMPVRAKTLSCIYHIVIQNS